MAPPPRGSLIQSDRSRLYLPPIDTAGMVKMGVALRVTSENFRDAEHLTETP